MLRVFIRPLAWVYGIIANIRNYFFDKKIFKIYKASLPVVSVGNITAGGTGKTPLCIAIARQAKSLNLKPVILSRGYRGYAKGPLLVSKNHEVKIVGDEALQYLEYQIPAVIAKSRVEGAKFIESKQLGDLIIMDDGFQHRWLKRDLDIVCVNTDNAKNIAEFNRGDILPLGRFRESKNKALMRADMLVFTNRTGDEHKSVEFVLTELPQKIRIYNSSISFGFNKPLPEADQVLAFCAIGNPEGFFETLKKCGIKNFKREVYPDHYMYAKSDLRALRDKYPRHLLICTEKDWIKVRNYDLENVFYLKIKTIIEANFFAEVFAAIH